MFVNNILGGFALEITFYRTLANKLANAVIENQEYSEADEKRIRYGLVCIFSDLYKFILLLIVFSIFSLTKELLIAFISVLLLRPFLAGYHAKNELTCIFMSFLTMWISILVGKMNIIPSTLELLLTILLPIIGLLIAPVRTKKVEEKKLKSKLITVFFTALILLVSAILVYILALYQMLKNYIKK